MSAASSPPTSAGSYSRRAIAAALMLVGAALALWSLFLPWKRLVPPAGSGLPDDQPPMIPITFYRPSPGEPIVLVLIFGPLVLLAVCALALLFARGQPRRLAKVVGVIAAIFGFGWSFLMLAFTGFLNDSAYVYKMESGAYIAFAGYALAIVGCVIARSEKGG